jgi:serine/threonine-protein kinase
MAKSLIGRTIDQYRVVGELGRGRYSVVYKAWHQSLERYVALKVLQRGDESTFKKFQTEARLTAYLIQEGAPNVRQLYKVGRTPEGYLFVALEYVEDSLANVLQRAKAGQHRSDPAAAARLLKPVAEALDAIHSLGWVHLDIKPQNILINGRGVAMLADFGIAQRQGASTAACTPAYASPEQAAGDRPVGPWSDVYALGVVLYEMIAGQLPVRGDQDIVLLLQHLEQTPPSPRSVNARLGPEQEKALFKALAKAPQSRFRSAGEFIQAMQPDALDVSGIQDPEREREPRSKRRRKIAYLLLGIAALVLFLALIGLIGWLLWPQLAAGPVVETGTAQATEAPVVINTETVAPPSGTVTVVPKPSRAPTDTRPPTATLAMTSTWTPIPTPRPTREATATATATTTQASKPLTGPGPIP